MHKSGFFWFVGGLMLLVVAATLWLFTAQPSQAQCGSQASSCKSCHEVQGQQSVNNDGTDWHEAHALGDFCYICHGGNQQATDKDEAHTGMVSPFADVDASCKQCHPNDAKKLAQKYADQLGIDLTSGGSAAALPPANLTAPTNNTGAGTGAAQPAISSVITRKISVDDPNLVDYSKRYDEIVLGKHPTNWGNIALIILIELLVIGGGAFVVLNEMRKWRAKTQKVEQEYPSDVVEMLPALADTRPQTRKTLKKLLAHSQVDKVVGAFDALVSSDKGDEQ